MYETLVDALRRGDAAQATSAAREAVAANPQDAAAHRLLAAALQLGGDREAALAAVDAALELHPEDAGLHVERAALLLTGRQLDAAESALARAVGLDPNQFVAYVMQGQIALARGDIDEADRIARTAARIAPAHPQVAAIEGMVALRRGDADRALAILAAAARTAPDEPTLRNALGFAYMAKGHFAFAEQCFRQQLELQPESTALRALIADLVRRQGRAAEAADEAAPLLERENVSPGLQRVVGQLELEAGRAARAIAPLKAAFEAMPGDPRTLAALVEAWRAAGAADEARTTLDAAIAATPENDYQWRARLAFEPFAGAEALAVVDRWIDARPDHIPPLQARAAIHDHAGETDEADAIAYQIVALEPGHAQAELRIVGRLLETDPAAAVARVETLLARAQDENIRRSLRELLGRCFDAAGDTGAALAAWAGLQAEVASQRAPLPPLLGAAGPLPEPAPRPADAPPAWWIWAPPGSLGDRVAVTLGHAGAPVCLDRYGPRPPADPLQRYGTATELAQGALDGGALVAQWRAALPARGVQGGPVFDWLVWWDNALLPAVRAHLPEATLLIAVRDPRDMLLEWLAFDSPQRFAFGTVDTASRWLAQAMEQIADLHEGDLCPHRLLRLDSIAHDAPALAAALGEALQVQLPPLPHVGAQRLAPGRWRAYAEPLADAFALLTPAAVRLGYPAA